MTTLLSACEELFGTRDLHAVLEVEKSASTGQIKKAYLRASLKVHPERVQDKEMELSTGKFQCVGAVYRVLSNRERRVHYDATGEVQDDEDPFGDTNINWKEYWRVVFPKVTLKNIEKAPKSKKTRKRAANNYNHYMKLSRQEFFGKNLNGQFDTTKAINNWKGMSSKDKEFYTDCFRKEKEEMGLSCSKKRKANVEDSSKKDQESIKVDGKQEIVHPTVEFLATLEHLDEDIENLRNENKCLCKELSNENATKAVNKYKLKLKAGELEALKDKYDQLLIQHKMCNN
eukprot:GFUD01113465.1.p1 GENE.GFUD01113465.1~~GFUD01113465.1.p1  ORF type:complete len:287 (-),score=61.27 GFUD01113465.1:8-868(-)